MRFLKKLKIPAIILTAGICIHVIYISIDGLIPYRGKADIALVLGNPVFDDGSLSPWLQGRVEKALDLYRAGRVRKIFLSGGIGENRIPEADAMKKWLRAHQVPDSVLIADNQGRNTYFTARDFCQWRDSSLYQSAIVVTSFYHITRSKYILNKQGCGKIYGVASDRFFLQDFFGLLRETAAFYFYLLRY